jgi:hypothetical protein
MYSYFKWLYHDLDSNNNMTKSQNQEKWLMQAVRISSRRKKKSWFPFYSPLQEMNYAISIICAIFLKK